MLTVLCKFCWPTSCCVCVRVASSPPPPPTPFPIHTNSLTVQQQNCVTRSSLTCVLTPLNSRYGDVSPSRAEPVLLLCQVCSRSLGTTVCTPRAKRFSLCSGMSKGFAHNFYSQTPNTRWTKTVPQLIVHVLGPALVHKHKRLSLCVFATSSPASHCFLVTVFWRRAVFVAQLVHLKSKFLHFNSFHVYLKLGRYKMLLLVPKKGKNTS